MCVFTLIKVTLNWNVVVSLLSLGKHKQCPRLIMIFPANVSSLQFSSPALCEMAGMCGNAIPTDLCSDKPRHSSQCQTCDFNTRRRVPLKQALVCL